MRRTLANMASFYTEKQSVDVREGLARRIQEGWFINKAPYGYRNVRKDGHSVVEICPDAGPKVDRRERRSPSPRLIRPLSLFATFVAASDWRIAQTLRAERGLTSSRQLATPTFVVDEPRARRPHKFGGSSSQMLHNSARLPPSPLHPGACPRRGFGASYIFAPDGSQSRGCSSCVSPPRCGCPSSSSVTRKRSRSSAAGASQSSTTT